MFEVKQSFNQSCIYKVMKDLSTKEQLRNYFECGVCLEEFNQNDKFPRILTCGHTFCQRCIAQIINRQIIFKCPECQLRLGLAYKNYSLLKLLTLNGLQKSYNLTYTIEKQTYGEIVTELDRLPKNFQKLIIKRTRDDEENPFEFDLIRNNKHSMRFFKLLVTFQKLKHFELWVKYSAHGFEQCLAETLFELKELKSVKIVNAYDEYERMREIIPLTANESIAFDIQIRPW